eukprot:7391485-Prymnesium_polylepis.4
MLRRSRRNGVAQDVEMQNPESDDETGAQPSRQRLRRGNACAVPSDDESQNGGDEGVASG